MKKLSKLTLNKSYFNSKMQQLHFPQVMLLYKSSFKSFDTYSSWAAKIKLSFIPDQNLSIISFLLLFSFILSCIFILYLGFTWTPFGISWIYCCTSGAFRFSYAEIYSYFGTAFGVF